MDTTSTHPRHRPRNSTRAATRSRRDLPQREDDRHGTGSTPSTSTARAARRRQSWPQTPCCHGRPARAGRHKHARVETRDPGTDRRSPEAGGGLRNGDPRNRRRSPEEAGRVAVRRTRSNGGTPRRCRTGSILQVRTPPPQAVQITSG